MKLADKQAAFVVALGELLQWSRWHPGYRIRMGETHVADTLRYAEAQLEMEIPSVHRRDGAHFNRLGADLILDKMTEDGWEWVEGDDPFWHDLGKYWKKRSEWAVWGGDFQIKDFNHFAFRHNGMA